MKRSIIFAVVATIGLAGAANAQTGKISLEGRGGIAVPTGSLKDAGASSGLAASLDLMYSVRPWLSIYGGGSRDEFDGNFSSTGVQAGAKIIPFRDGSMMPWMNFGALGHKFNSGGADSSMELGVEAGVGADFAITDRFSLSPGVRYRTYNATITPGEVNARYFVWALGAHLHLR